MYFEEDYKSRSQKKRESSALQDLGERIAALSPGLLANLDLPPELADAILEWKQFPGHEAKRRQMQYIGRLMREMDQEALSERLDALLQPARQELAALHQLEELRDSLVQAEEGQLDAAIATVKEQFPKAESA